MAGQMPDPHKNPGGFVRHLKTIPTTYTATWTHLAVLVRAAAGESLVAQIVKKADAVPANKTNAASGEQYLRTLDALLAEEKQRPLMSLNDVKQEAMTDL